MRTKNNLPPIGSDLSPFWGLLAEDADEEQRGNNPLRHPEQTGGLIRTLRCPTCHRTNTDSKLGQTATRVSDRSRYRRLAGGISLGVIRECVCLPVEGR